MPGTRSEWVQAVLREEILDAVLAPGEPLITTAIAARLGVSATPVREALRLLETDGFVELTPHGPARVASASATEAVEIYELRCLVEPEAVQRAVQRGGAEYLAGVEHAFAGLVAADEAISHRVHSEFHRALFAGCESAWMRHEAERLMEHGQRFVAAAAGAMGLMAHPVEAHHPLRDLAIAGDATGAAAELDRHLRASLDFIRTLAHDDRPREESA